MQTVLRGTTQLDIQELSEHREIRQLEDHKRAKRSLGLVGSKGRGDIKHVCTVCDVSQASRWPLMERKMIITRKERQVAD